MDEMFKQFKQFEQMLKPFKGLREATAIADIARAAIPRSPLLDAMKEANQFARAMTGTTAVLDAIKQANDLTGRTSGAKAVLDSIKAAGVFTDRMNGTSAVLDAMKPVHNDVGRMSAILLTSKDALFPAHSVITNAVTPSPAFELMNSLNAAIHRVQMLSAVSGLFESSKILGAMYKPWAFGELDRFSQMLGMLKEHSAASQLHLALEGLPGITDALIQEEPDAWERFNAFVAAVYEQLKIADQFVERFPLRNLIGLIFALYTTFLASPDKELQRRLDEIRQQLTSIQETQVKDAERDREVERQLQELADQVAIDQVRILKTKARIHSQPKGSSQVVAALPRSHPVVLLLVRGRWAYIETIKNGHIFFGWVPKKVLRIP